VGASTTRAACRGPARSTASHSGATAGSRMIAHLDAVHLVRLQGSSRKGDRQPARARVLRVRVRSVPLAATAPVLSGGARERVGAHHVDDAFVDFVEDGSRRVVESFLHVHRRLGRRLQKHQPVLPEGGFGVSRATAQPHAARGSQTQQAGACAPCEALALLPGHDAARVQVALVADEHDGDVGVGVLTHESPRGGVSVRGPVALSKHRFGSGSLDLPYSAPYHGYITSPSCLVSESTHPCLALRPSPSDSPGVRPPATWPGSRTCHGASRRTPAAHPPRRGSTTA
jgi:hypothetical protein